MNAIEALLQRSSMPRLEEPAPSEEALDTIFRAALRAADHKVLRPWRFLVIRGQSLDRLGDLFASAAQQDDAELSTSELDKIRQKPLRAPLIVVIISSPKANPKVPLLEQDLSAAAATQNMLVAAYAQDIGAMWRTGSMAYHPVVMKGLGLKDQEKIIGFLYLGTAAAPGKQIPNEDPSDFVQEW